MAVTQPRSRPTSIGIDTTGEDDVTLTNIGIEFEYPIGNELNEMVCSAAESRDLEDRFGPDDTWLDGYGGEGGTVLGEHTGAEIITGILDLHSTQPESWYMESIKKATDAGSPFAARGNGSTHFGMHQHVSYIPREYGDIIQDGIDAEWSRVFFCASVSGESLDPWRHGSFATPPGSSMNWRGEGTDGHHFEFRFPEPVHPDHFPLLMDFWRIAAKESPEAALDFARERVYEKDERLTPIKQYKIIEEDQDGFPNRDMFRGGRTDQHVAEWFHDLME